MILVTELLPLLGIHTEPELSMMMPVGVLMPPPWYPVLGVTAVPVALRTLTELLALATQT